MGRLATHLSAGVGMRVGPSTRPDARRSSTRETRSRPLWASATVLSKAVAHRNGGAARQPSVR